MLKKTIKMLLVVGSCICFSLSADSPFYAPILKGNVKKIKELLSDRYIKIDEADVALAALKGHAEIVALLLAKGAPLDSSVMRSAVRGACENKKRGKAYEEIVHMLLKAHAPFDKETVCMAVECGNMAIVKMLVDAMPAFSSLTPLKRLHSA